MVALKPTRVGPRRRRHGRRLRAFRLGRADRVAPLVAARSVARVLLINKPSDRRLVGHLLPLIAVLTVLDPLLVASVRFAGVDDGLARSSAGWRPRWRWSGSSAPCCSINGS